ncbi:MAG: hypothetical protein EP330_25810 [Deltaproteobacteria bacterium]|nr:MAG: hypothetical protein EP330_25810 [Deltaproteobacteria bacterium]
MSLTFYKILHVAAVAWLFAAMGGSLLAGSDNERARKLGGMSHGIALIVALVAGFGALAKLGIDGMPGWVIAKVVLWVVFGAVAMVPRRAPQLAVPVFFALPVLAGVATWLAVAKPF